MPSHDGSILICLSPAPSNRIIIEAAAGMHRSKDAALIALFIETPGYEQLSDRDKQRLNANMALARTFGAEIEVVSGVDIPFQIAEYARRQDIFRIVMGQGIVPHSRLLPVQDFAEELLRYLPEAELHIIPDGSRKAHYRPHEDDRSSREQILVDLLFSLLILSVATLLGTLFDSLHFSDSTIMMSYLLGVLLISIGTSHRGYSLVAAVVSILLFNYFFVQPRFSLQVLESGYPVTLLVMFLTSFITGTLAVRLKSAARQAAQTAYRTKIISDTDQMLAKCSGKSEILDVCSRQVQKLLSQPFQLQSHDDGVCLAVSEFESSDSLANFPLQSKSRIYAVLSVDVSRKPIEVAEHGILLSILGECTLALENEQNAREKEEAAPPTEPAVNRDAAGRKENRAVRESDGAQDDIPGGREEEEDDYIEDEEPGGLMLPVLVMLSFVAAGLSIACAALTTDQRMRYLLGAGGVICIAIALSLLWRITHPKTRTEMALKRAKRGEFLDRHLGFRDDPDDPDARVDQMRRERRMQSVSLSRWDPFPDASRRRSTS